MTTAKQFLNDVVKPWEELNAALGQAYAIDPQVSDFVRDARQLAIAIKHYAEVVGISKEDRRAMRDESQPYEIMDDVADAAKHGALDKSGRRNALSLSALYEFNAQNHTRFIRNAIEIKHNTLGELDFMHVARDAITYCMGRFAFGRWAGMVLESGPAEFYEKVKLRFDPRLGVGMTAFSLKFFKREDNGELVVADPPNGFHFEVMDLSPALRR